MKRHPRNKVVIGITGSFGSGKTTVARLLHESSGAFVIDADRIVHGLLRSDKTVKGKIRKVFGGAIFKKDKTVDRGKLAALVFQDVRELKKLNAIVHPAVIAVIRRKAREAQAGIVAIDAPLLIEAGLARAVDKVIVVTLPFSKLTERLLKRKAFSKDEIRKRIKAQMPQEAKRRFADFVIDNSGALADTAGQVRRALKKITEEK
jgi:dephospho-CoA kinase